MRIAIFVGIVILTVVPTLCQAESAEESQRPVAETEKPLGSAEGVSKPNFISKDIVIEKIKKGKPVEFTSESILFEFAKAEVREDSLPQLHVIAESLKDPKLADVPKFGIAGHTCDIGSDRKNCRLSWERAAAVVDYLVSVGVDRSRLVTLGYGETMPKYSNSSEENRRKNRRVVLVGKKNEDDPGSLIAGRVCDRAGGAGKKSAP